MRYVLLSLLIAALSAVPAAGAPSPRGSTLAPGWDETKPRWSPDGRSVLVQRAWDSPKKGSFYELGTVGLSGERRRVGRWERTIYEQWDRHGAWAPDGKLVAFTRTIGLEATYVYVAAPGGAGQRRLSPVDADRDYSPAWAPDGQRLVFARDGRIATMRADGSDVRAITAGDDYEPSWSPDGQRIAFLRLARSGSTTVFTVRPDGSGLTRVTPAGDYELGGWSPDSSRLLAVAGASNGRDRVVVLRVDAGDRLMLGPGTAPDWSPSGDRVAFYRPDGLYVVPSRGGTPRRVHRFVERAGVNDEYAIAPDWSPDGRRLAFANRGRCLGWGAYVLDLASGRAERVSNDCNIVGTRRRDVLRGTRERDLVRALGGNDQVDGNPRDLRNEYAGRRDDDVLDGGGGADTIRGRRDHDVLRGGPGNDRLFAGDGKDALFGGPGADWLFARDGLRNERGWAGDTKDVLDGGPGADRLFTRDGFRDTVRCGPGQDRVQADERDFVSRDCELVDRR